MPVEFRTLVALGVLVVGGSLVCAWGRHWLDENPRQRDQTHSAPAIVAGNSDASGMGAAGPTAQWRRTVDGWERADLWLQRRESAASGLTAPNHQPHPHPFWLVGLEVLAATASLSLGRSSARPATPRRRRTDWPAAATAVAATA
ncbi:MAG: hypothetical protein KDA41_05130 [Planctomycetales bacterium]|nr:hypothetical protein [Planctomycetales bacterium]